MTDLRDALFGKIAEARRYADREGFELSTVCLSHEATSLLLAALAPKPTGTEAGRGVGAVPAGWKLVPEEPTHRMIAAGWLAIEKAEFQTEDNDVSPVYAAMLAATPTPPTPDSTAQGDGTSREGIPAEVEALARTIAAEKIGSADPTGARLPADIWEQALPEAQFRLSISTPPQGDR